VIGLADPASASWFSCSGCRCKPLVQKARLASQGPAPVLHWPSRGVAEVSR